MPYTSPQMITATSEVAISGNLIVRRQDPTPSSDSHSRSHHKISGKTKTPPRQRSASRKCRPRAADDSTFNSHPYMNIDYFSHNWHEEDVKSTWKYLRSHSRQFLNRSRLENAAWRTWAKCRNGLRTAAPEILNW